MLGLSFVGFNFSILYLATYSFKNMAPGDRLGNWTNELAVNQTKNQLITAAWTEW